MRAALLALLAALCSMPAAVARETRAEAARVLQSVVSVLPDWPADKRPNEEPEGSGVVILDGSHIITALHVLGAAERVRVATSGGNVFEARIVGRDEVTDLALLAIDQDLPALAFGSDPEVGEKACAVGNAFGLGLSITCGTVSAVNRAGVGFNPVEDFVQTDAAVNPGSSGGALVNSDGELIGILSAIFTKQSDANIGVNFAVSAALAARVAAALKEEGRIRFPAAGMRLVPALEAGKTGMRGARVERVLSGRAAEAAGIQADDVILEAGGRRVMSPADFVSVMARQAPSAQLTLRVLRQGRESDIILQVDK